MTVRVPALRRQLRGSINQALVTLPGFHMLPDGRSRVFVELTKSVEVVERRGPKSVVFTLRGARVPLRNNRNALVTSHFHSVVSRARVSRAAGDVDLVIELRAPVTPVHRVVNLEAGGARLEVDFPPVDDPIAEERAGGAARSAASSSAAKPAATAPASGDDVVPAGGGEASP